jgi:hypothetical protein
MEDGQGQLMMDEDDSDQGVAESQRMLVPSRKAA